MGKGCQTRQTWAIVGVVGLALLALAVAVFIAKYMKVIKLMPHVNETSATERNTMRAMNEIQAALTEQSRKNDCGIRWYEP